MIVDIYFKLNNDDRWVWIANIYLSEKALQRSYWIESPSACLHQSASIASAKVFAKRFNLTIRNFRVANK